MSGRLKLSPRRDQRPRSYDPSQCREEHDHDGIDIGGWIAETNPDEGDLVRGRPGGDSPGSEQSGQEEDRRGQAQPTQREVGARDASGRPRCGPGLASGANRRGSRSLATPGGRRGARRAPPGVLGARVRTQHLLPGIVDDPGSKPRSVARLRPIGPPARLRLGHRRHAPSLSRVALPRRCAEGFQRSLSALADWSKANGLPRVTPLSREQLPPQAQQAPPEPPPPPSPVFHDAMDPMSISVAVSADRLMTQCSMLRR